ncbi:MAG: hypothetical protein H6713_35420 [Myxococcales bacterium]|nr:hypothetical protein [Myxococcales bacterium]
MKSPSLSQLRAAVLPFVTRSLRGNRLRRYTLLSMMLAGLTVIIGAWITLSPGGFERELRQEFGMEESRYERERQEFTIFADEQEDFEEYLRARAELATPGWNPYGYRADELANRANEARALVHSAVLSPAPLERRALAAHAQAALAKHDALHPAGLPNNHWDSWSFDWYNDRDVALLQTIVDAELRPHVVRYESPFGLRDALRFTGVLAGIGLTMLTLVFGPLLVGTQMAQEAHENTLMPLTGTGLRARDLVLGLFAGPMTVIAIVALPQAALLLLAATFTGSLTPALAVLPVVAAASFFLSMLTMLVGLAIGRRRTPGVIGIALLAALGGLAMIGLGLGFSIRGSSAGVLALLPDAAAIHLVRASLVPPEPLWTYATAVKADTAIALGAFGVGLLGLLGARALERQLSGVPGVSLSRLEAFCAAAISIVMVSRAFPVAEREWNIEEAFYINLGLLTIPLLVTLMMRVPVGDIPARMRKIPLWSIVGELFSYVALFGLVTLLSLRGTQHLDDLFHPIALMYLCYTLVLAALLVIRVTAVPASIAGRLWIGFCGMFTCMTFVHAAEWADRGSRMDLEDVFALFHVSPVLGLAQLGLTVVVPILLVRAIRPPEAPSKPEAAAA